MEIRIVITKQNKEKILRLIDELVECEAEVVAVTSPEKEILSLNQSTQPVNFLKEIPKVGGISVAEPDIKENKFGSWGMFNSYVPGKATLRVLIHLMNKNDGKSVKYGDLVDECIIEFWKAGLKRRGFPKKTSESARSRLAMHLIWPYYEMGLIKIFGEKNDPSVVITKEGVEFANLRNPVLDNGRKRQPLSSEERKWLLDHLKKIDELGYREFTVFNELIKFLSRGKRRFEDIVNHFKTNKEFESWIRQGSRHRDAPKAFARQLHNISKTFSSGKIALLRELGIVSDSRAKYKVIGKLEA